MIDRENVIDNLEQNIRWIEEIECHQFPGWGNVTMAMRDAVELLKEQEAIKPKLVGVNTWTCGECGTLLGWEDLSQSGLELINYKYCPGCGRRVKWG